MDETVAGTVRESTEVAALRRVFGDGIADTYAREHAGDGLPSRPRRRVLGEYDPHASLSSQ